MGTQADAFLLLETFAAMACILSVNFVRLIAVRIQLLQTTVRIIVGRTTDERTDVE